ncbi:MAG: serine/threonine-protein kinase [Gemmatimonadota bacterium]|nr:serine/threonine-protein kinase [Gemmatimonadota bacterium]
MLTRVLAGRYEIEREIGRGGMATVYLARDLRHDSTVAVKVLHPELAAFLGFERFQREIQVTARLQHPNLLPVFDSGRSGALEYYVTPYIEGESLADRIGREQQLPIEDTLELTCEVADALAYAHNHGLVHRDIKPGNILLTHGHAVVADFGIARIVGASGDGRLTASGMALGTVAYMSPEQASGGDVDGRSDIYSLGCVLYEMLAGAPPFSGANAQAVIARHMVEPPPPLRAVRPSVTAALEAVVRKALAKSPADRFANASQFRDALRRVRAIGAPDAPSTSRTSLWGERRARFVAVGLVTAAIAAVMLVAPHKARLHGVTRTHAEGTTNLARIAVLYFNDNSPSHDMAYLAGGLTDELIHQLSAVPALHVVSRNGVLPYRDRPVSVDSIATALQVGSVVTGSVQKFGDKVRVDVELVDANTGTHLGSRTIEHSTNDLFALEDDVSQQVAILLRTRLGQQIRIQQIQEGTSSVQARRLVLQAVELRDEAATIAADTRAGNSSDAIGLFQRADTLLAAAEVADPNWVQPLIERGWVMWGTARVLSPKAGSRQLRLAQEYAEQALRLAPNNPEALEFHGTVLWELARNAINDRADPSSYISASTRDLRQAVAIQPTLARAWSALGTVLYYTGDVAEANMAARRALAADAYLENAPAILYQLYTSEELLGNYPAARQACSDGRRFPNDWRFVECRLTLMPFESGPANPKAAWALVAQLDSMDPPVQAAASQYSYSPIFWRMEAAVISARAGQSDSARAVIAWAEHQIGNDSSARIDLDYDEANVRLALGEPVIALRLLTEYAAARPTLKPYIGRDPRFATLRTDPRFAAQFTTMLRAPTK